MGTVNPLDMPRFRESAMYLFVKDELRVPVTATLIHNAIKSRKIAAIKLSGNNHFSTRSVLDWVESIGIPVDWDVAQAECKRALARDVVLETDSALSELS